MRTSIRATVRPVLQALLFACISAPSLGAQDTTRIGSNPWVVGGSFGVPGVASHVEPELFTVSVHGTQVRNGRPGPELFIGTMPRALAEGLLAVGVRAGLVLPIELSPDLFVLPSAGAGMVAGFGDGGGLVEPGVNIGAAAIVLNEASAGFRAGITWHWFSPVEGAFWLAEVGIVRRLERR